MILPRTPSSCVSTSIVALSVSCSPRAPKAAKQSGQQRPLCEEPSLVDSGQADRGARPARAKAARRQGRERETATHDLEQDVAGGKRLALLDLPLCDAALGHRRRPCVRVGGQRGWARSVRLRERLAGEGEARRAPPSRRLGTAEREAEAASSARVGGEGTHMAGKRKAGGAAANAGVSTRSWTRCESSREGGRAGRTGGSLEAGRRVQA